MTEKDQKIKELAELVRQSKPLNARLEQANREIEMFRNSQKEDHGKHLEEVAGLKKENM